MTTTVDADGRATTVYTEENTQPIGKRQALIALPVHRAALLSFIGTIEQIMGARASTGMVCEAFHAPDFRTTAHEIVELLERRGYNASYAYSTCTLEVSLPIQWAEKRALEQRVIAAPYAGRT